MTNRARVFGLTVAMIAAGVTTAQMMRPTPQSDTTRNPLATAPGAIADGQRTYDRACQSCHGPAGQGDRGPALNTGVFTHGREDGDLFHTIREGAAGTQMPPFRNLSDTQTWQLVSYIRSLVPPTGPSIPPAGRGAAPAPQAVVATLRDGREVRGLRRNEDTFSIQIADASGQLHLLDKLTLAALRVDDANAPRAPSGLPATGGVTFNRLVNAAAEPHNWLMYWGNLQGTHYSPLEEIDTANVRQLQMAWAFPMPGDSVLEATPLVVDDVMYNTQPGAVFAIDARTGRQIWKYARAQKVRSPYEINPFNRGAAVLGHRLFVGTLDAALVALDARTGSVLWEMQVADSMLGYSLTSAPLVVKDKVLVGITGGEFGARGFLDAYDAVSGRRLWRWYAVPEPGEFGNDTWKGDSWQRGGSPMWLTGSYDPDLNLVYWTVGNPAPQIDRSARGELDNLFSDSVVAIDPDTGQRKWHYQFTPNDGHDWDSCQDVILVDRVWHGRMQKLLLHADRNGIFYVLDRTTGKLLSGTPFVHVNWTSGFDASGRPIVVPGSNSSPEGSFFVYPTLVGGTNFQAPSYSPLTGWLYLEYSENGQRYASEAVPFETGRQYIGRKAPDASVGPKPGEPRPSAGIKALDPETGKTMWDFKIVQGSLTNGVLATAGNVLFGAIRDGNLVALDAKTGAHLWHVQTGGNLAASPISYAVGGRQFVAISAGNMVYAFTLPETR
jgi:alcohol dehydrogenase (cytochrome c)